MKKFFILTFFIFSMVFLDAEIKVVTTLSFLGDIVKQVGQEKVEVVSLIDGSQDPHFVEPRPSMINEVKNADLVVVVGMSLDMWIDSIIDASRNEKVFYGKIGYLDTSVGIEKLEVISGKVDGRLGDLHPEGNPHYWLNPENVKIIAKSISLKLSQISPKDKNYFEKNLENYISLLNNKISMWENKVSNLTNSNIITYHKSWIYFAEKFRLNIVAELEPKPGIPPSAKHLARVIEIAKNNNVKFILKEIFYPKKSAEYVSKQAGIKVVEVPNDIIKTKNITSYVELIDFIINKISQN
jgi:zinc/manganese transport system substrate-binding protein